MQCERLSRFCHSVELVGAVGRCRIVMGKVITAAVFERRHTEYSNVALAAAKTDVYPVCHKYLFPDRFSALIERNIYDVDCRGQLHGATDDVAESAPVAVAVAAAAATAAADDDDDYYY